MSVIDKRIKQSAPMSKEQKMAAIRQALEQSNGMVTPAAEILGVSRATFWRMRKLYGI